MAVEVLKVREAGRAALLPDMKDYGPILKVGASAGGARAKAIIGWKESTGEVRSGQVKLPDGFGYWLMKFDGVHGNGDKDGEDAKGYGRVEYAYSLMAMAAGIEMSECRLWDGVHFMTRRFDRTSNGGKIHMQTLGALAHFDYNMPRQYSYEQAFRVLRAIVNDIRAEEELFRRMVFNVFAWNCDDHVKNISFLIKSYTIISLLNSIIFSVKLTLLQHLKHLTCRTKLNFKFIIVLKQKADKRLCLKYLNMH